MGVNFRYVTLDQIQPMCSSCGIALCWDIEVDEYLKWSNFWDDWECCQCNTDYEHALTRFKVEHQPYEGIQTAINNITTAIKDE